MNPISPPERLSSALRSGSLIICTGPGVDVAAGLPSTQDLARMLLDCVREAEFGGTDTGDIEDAIAKGRYGDALQQLQFSLGRATFQRRVADGLSSRYSIPPFIASIAQLHEQLRAVYTTCLVDGLFNRAFRGRWPSHDDPRPHLAQKRRLIFHLRGTLGRAESWVLTEEQEHSELRAESPRGKLLGTVYNAHCLLLIGFEPESSALRSLLDMLPPVSSGRAPEHFMAVEGPCSAEARRRLARRGFVVVTNDPEQLLLALGGTGELAGVEPTGECPYPGLEAFDEGRASAFFGRHVEVSQAAARLGAVEGGEHRRWLAVEGSSGVGKSSFVHAGIVPALRNGFATGTPERWKVARMRPGVRPLRNLVGAVLDALGLAGCRGGPEATVERVRESPKELAELISEGMPEGHGLLLVVDQLEESVTFAAEAERAPFGLALAQALAVPEFYLVTTIRTDFVPALQARLPSLASLLNERAERYALPPISRVGLREAIVEPAAREAVMIELDLLELMLADADSGGEFDGGDDGEARSSESALPLVAHVLRALWDAGAAENRVITTEEYRALGGVRGALSQSAEAALEGLDAAALEGAEALLLGLVRVHAEGGETRRTLERAEAVALAGGAERGEQLLLRLSGAASGGDAKAKARLLVVHREGEREHVDLVHEALLRDWDRYRELIDGNRRLLLLDDELERRAKRWDEAGRPKKDLAAGRDLAQLLEGRPRGPDVQLQRRYQRALRVAKRRRRRSARARWVAWMSALVIVAVAAVVVAVVMVGKNEEIGEQNTDLKQQKVQLEEKERAQRDLLSVQRGLRAQMLIPENRESEALLLGVQAVGAYGPDWNDAPPPEATEGLERVLADDAVIIDESVILKGHEGLVRAVAYSPDGSRIATASEDGTARVWDPSTGTLLTTLEGHEGFVYAIAYSPDALQIATASWDGSARVWDASTGNLVTILKGHENHVFAITYSPDGSQIATASWDGTVRVWDPSTGTSLTTLEGHEGEVYAVAYSPDGSRVATASRDKTARVWDPLTGQLLSTFKGHSNYVQSVTYSPDGSRVATASWDGRGRVWNGSTGKRIATLEGHKSEVYTVAYSPNGSRVATASSDGTAKIWDPSTGNLITTLKGHLGGVTDVTFSPDGSQVVTGSWDGTARVWDPSTGNQIATLEGHKQGVHMVAYSPDGSRIATASSDGTARVWDPSTGNLLAALKAHERVVFVVAYSPDGSRIATAGRDNTAKVWDPSTGGLLATLRGHKDEVYEVAYSPDGSHIATASLDGTARVWDSETGHLLITFKDHHAQVFSVVYSPDGSEIATVSSDGTARVWDPSTGHVLATLRGHEKEIYAVAYSPDGFRLATASHDGTARVWAPSTSSLIATLEGHTNYVTKVIYSPDGSRIATASSDNTARVWDPSSGHLLVTFRGHQDEVNAIAFSPDGSRVATASSDSSAGVWDPSTGSLQVALKGHEDEVIAVAFSPDGSYLATASFDNSARVWDPSTGRLIATLEGHVGEVNDVAFSPDGTRLATASDDHTAKIWDPETGELIIDLKDRIGLVQPDGSIDWPVLPPLLTRIGCQRLQPFEDDYAQAADICDPLLAQDPTSE